MSSFTAKMIKEARINANLSQEEAAKALGITDRTLRSLKNNQHPVSVDDLLSMAKLYAQFLFHKKEKIQIRSRPRFCVYELGMRDNSNLNDRVSCMVCFSHGDSPLF